MDKKGAVALDKREGLSSHDVIRIRRERWQSMMSLWIRGEVAIHNELMDKRGGGNLILNWIRR